MPGDHLLPCLCRAGPNPEGSRTPVAAPSKEDVYKAMHKVSSSQRTGASSQRPGASGRPQRCWPTQAASGKPVGGAQLVVGAAAGVALVQAWGSCQNIRPAGHPEQPPHATLPPPPPPPAPQGTKSSKRKKQNKLKRVMQTLKKQERRSAATTNESFAAVHLLHDPQTFAERLFARLQSGGERYETRLAVTAVVSRCGGPAAAA